MDKVEAFRALHIPGDPLVLFNIWDAGSAKAVAAAGAKAIATGSYGVAEARGRSDGENLPIEVVLDNLAEILGVTELPVTIDMESGYGSTPDEVGASIARARELGAAGINMEDRLAGSDTVLPVDEAASRIEAAAGTGIFVNARCDVFRKRDATGERRALIAEALERASAYGGAGARSFFVPFIHDPAIVAAICAKSPLPVNVLWSPAFGDRAALAALGVARISHGHQPWAAAMAWVSEQAKAVLGGEVPPYAA